MRYVAIEHAEPGVVLAKPIYDELGRVLIGINSTISKDIIDKLALRGFPGFYIEDELSKDIFIEETITAELRNSGVKALRSGNIEATIGVAKNIVDEIMSSSSISLDLIDLRTFDDYTYRHSVNVAVLSTVIGMGLQMNRANLEDLCTAAVFHDVGKRMIDPKVLNKPARLNREEYEIMKKHPQFSYDILKERVDVSSTSRAGVLYHHENEDGSGYPSGLESKEIHVFAKIIHVADVYDALISKRPYKMPYPLFEAIEYLMGGCHILFDERVVKVFLDLVPVYPMGVTVQLSNGREGIVIENTNTPLRPKVRLYDGTEIDLGDSSKNRNITIIQSTDIEIDFSDEIGITARKFEQQKKDILVVEDIDSDFKIMRKVLKDDYNVYWVKNGIQAIDYLKNKSIPELILMDIDLPGMDGIETVKVIHQTISKDIPIIFSTAMADKQTVLRSMQVGVKDFIAKPLKPAYIYDRIKTVIKSSKTKL